MNTRLTRARADAVGLAEPAIDGDAPALPAAGFDGAALPAVEMDPPTASVEAARRRRTLPQALRPGGPAWIWFGIVVAIAGFVLLAVGWGQVAAETQVYLQLPYVVSAALVGLGLVMVGLAVLNVASRQRDGIERDAQISQLIVVMEELKAVVAEREAR